MVAVAPSSSCNARTRRSIAGEHMSGAHADTPTWMRPAPLPFQSACDWRIRAVPRPLGEHAAHAAAQQRRRMAADAGAVLEQERRAAANRFEDAELGHDRALAGLEWWERQFGESAREWRPMRRGEIFLDGARDRPRQMRVRV